VSAPDSARLAGLLERLVAFDTQNPPGQETAAAEMLAEELRGYGLEAAARPVAHEGFPPRANAVGILRNGPGPVICFNSHIDTVPVGVGWGSDPLRLIQRDGRLFGRGACDAKGPIVAMAEACRLLAADRDAWHGTVVATFVADEELNSRGSKAVAAEFPAFDGVIVGEPTDNQVLSAHRGAVRPLIRVHGVTAHSSRPHLGVNAIDGAARLLRALGAYDRQIGRRQHPLVGCACVSATQIHGGFADNIIPDRCDIVLDRRLLPDETTEGVLAELQGLLDEVRASDNVIAELFEIRGMAGGCETPESAPVVQAALAAAARHGANPALGGLTGGCDLVHFRVKGSPGIVLGPGSLDLAHKPDEYVPRAALVQAAAIYRDIALGMLGA
jgi:acetylornithine deacetylase/succinyl-diaminopimelate desuccinylase family protein